MTVDKKLLRDLGVGIFKKGYADFIKMIRRQIRLPSI
jgi:hypothetical protein